MDFSEAKFYENYLTSDFHKNTACYFKMCLPTCQGGFQNRDRACRDLSARVFPRLTRVACICFGFYLIQCVAGICLALAVPHSVESPSKESS